MSVDWAVAVTERHANTKTTQQGILASDLANRGICMRNFTTSYRVRETDGVRPTLAKSDKNIRFTVVFACACGASTNEKAPRGAK